MVKFYDMKTRKTVHVPESRTRRVTKGKARMLVAKGPRGNDMYRIVGRA